MSTNFQDLAVQAFTTTFETIYEQSLIESDRLRRVNQVMRTLEDRLFDPEVLADLRAQEMITLVEVLSRTQQASIRSLMGFSRTLMDVKAIVHIQDTINKATSLEHSPMGSFPTLPGNLIDGNG